MWSESHSVVSDSLQPHRLYSPWNSPGQNTGVGSLSFLQGIFPTQGSNLGLPHCRQILYQLSYQEAQIALYYILIGYFAFWMACSVFSHFSLRLSCESEKWKWSRSVMSDSLRDCSLPGSSVHGIFLGKGSGVGCHFLFRGGCLIRL